MKLNKRQEAFLSIFGIAFAALVVDRAFLSRARGPAGAYGATEQAANELVLVPPAIPDATCQSPVMRLSARLETLYAGRQFDAEHFRDAFVLPDSWASPAQPQDLSAQVSKTTAQFSARHQLQAVVVDGQASHAFINDRFVSLGQEIDGFRLIDVDQGSATFEAGIERITLKLHNDR